jgi:hypothetical protein
MPLAVEASVEANISTEHFVEICLLVMISIHAIHISRVELDA